MALAMIKAAHLSRLKKNVNSPTSMAFPTLRLSSSIKSNIAAIDCSSNSVISKSALHACKCTRANMLSRLECLPNSVVKAILTKANACRSPFAEEDFLVVVRVDLPKQPRPIRALHSTAARHPGDRALADPSGPSGSGSPAHPKTFRQRHFLRCGAHERTHLQQRPQAEWTTQLLRRLVGRRDWSNFSSRRRTT